MKFSLPAPSDLASLWALDTGIAFLNHGSFGACPNAVLTTQHELRERMERQPVQFLSRDLEGLLEGPRIALAEFADADPADLVFVNNATTGVNAVLRSLRFERGDEILITDHGYNACSNAARFAADRAGARVTVARIPFPLRSPDEVVAAVLATVTPRTRLAVVDHVTSSTGLVLPIEHLVAELEGRSVQTLVDGAHGPGMVSLALRSLGASYYAGNCHKWLCAPKGAAFLWVRRDRQPEVRPTVISHGANSVRTDRSRFGLEFDWPGTADPTAVLALPAALALMASLRPGGWPEVMARNRALALKARAALCEALDVAPPAPDSMIGALAALPLPDATQRPRSPIFEDALQTALLARHGIEVPVFHFPEWPRRLLRISAQAYNTFGQFQYLGAALRAEL